MNTQTATPVAPLNYTPLPKELHKAHTIKEDDPKTKAIKDLFISTLQEKTICGNILVACERTGLARRTMYEWKEKDEEFAKRWNDAVFHAKVQLRYEAEFQLRKQMIEGNTTATIFILKNVAADVWNKPVEDVGNVTNVQNNQFNYFNIAAEEKVSLNKKFKDFLEAEYG